MLTALATLFVVGSFWFWALIVLSCVALLAFIEHEQTFWATITMIATLALLHWCGDAKLVPYLLSNPLKTLMFVAGYFGAGTLWSVGKWYFFVKQNRDRYDETKASFLARYNIRDKIVPERLRKEWRELAERGGSGYGSSFEVKPSPKNHKSRILMWMTYWPWSMLWTLINDPVRRLFKMIYRKMQAVYQAISNSVFKDTDDELRVPVDPEAEEIARRPIR